MREREVASRQRARRVKTSRHAWSRGGGPIVTYKSRHGTFEGCSGGVWRAQRSYLCVS